MDDGKDIGALFVRAELQRLRDENESLVARIRKYEQRIQHLEGWFVDIGLKCWRAQEVIAKAEGGEA